MATSSKGEGLASGCTLTIGVARLMTADAQAAFAQGLVRQLHGLLRSDFGEGPSSSLQQLADSLRPSCGWLPSVDIAKLLRNVPAGQKSALRCAVDAGRWEIVKALLEAKGDARGPLSEPDLRSPLTVALERGETMDRVSLLADLGAAGVDAQHGRSSPQRCLSDLSELLRQRLQEMSVASAKSMARPSAYPAHPGAKRRASSAVPMTAHGIGTGATPSSSSSAGTAAFALAPPRPWESVAKYVARYFGPAAAKADSAKTTGPTGQTRTAGELWACDVYVLALELCPSGKGRRRLLEADGACSALWRCCLDLNLPDLARKLAVWIGLSTGGASDPASPSSRSRRRLLDVELGPGQSDSILAHALERGLTDERWMRVSRVLTRLGACTNANTPGGSSVVQFALEQADQGKAGFKELTDTLLQKVGTEVDQWERPTALLEERTAECPICLENLWTSTPTAFVGFTKTGPSREEVAHVICAHFFCFDCASQQYMKQQAQRSSEYNCPICRAKALEIMPLPDITMNPKLWFQFLDTNCNGKIDKNTVVLALEAMLPIDTESLHTALDERCWDDWRKSKSDHITESDFFAHGGLLEWIREHQHELDNARARGPAPSLDRAEDWFQHWDSSKSGQLRRGEALRALCEAAQVSSLELKRIQKLKDAIESLWTGRAASPEQALSKEAFLSSGIAQELAKAVQDVKGPSAAAGGA
eukprot:TRINITY_DN64894_c0_g1_i1.p1 TRINITY_DN64894_c0_g1~~TRINITY_DN64894_c0_g1_i1.p1  ORF type:complete len:706 (+),score=123.22 TRINITY_DN64894_c0_g1_i1:393-2510(+)